MVSALRSFLSLTLANTSRRAVHIDTGANDGRSTVHVWRQLCTDAHASLSSGSGTKHLFVLVEAQSRFVGTLHELAANLTRQSRACDVRVVGAAAWTHDGVVAFSQNVDPRGAYVGAQRQKGQRGVVTVPSIDFGAFLRRTLRHDDNVMLKLDVSNAASSSCCPRGSRLVRSVASITFSSNGTSRFSMRTTRRPGWRAWGSASHSRTSSNGGARRALGGVRVSSSTTSSSSLDTTMSPGCGNAPGGTTVSRSCRCRGRVRTRSRHRRRRRAARPR